MGKIVMSDNVSLDGVVQDPAGDEGFRVGHDCRRSLTTSRPTIRVAALWLGEATLPWPTARVLAFPCEVARHRTAGCAGLSSSASACSPERDIQSTIARSSGNAELHAGHDSCGMPPARWTTCRRARAFCLRRKPRGSIQLICVSLGRTNSRCGVGLEIHAYSARNRFSRDRRHQLALELFQRARARHGRVLFEHPGHT